MRRLDDYDDRYYVLVFGRGYLASVLIPVASIPSADPCGVQTTWEARCILGLAAKECANYDSFALDVLAQLPQGTEVDFVCVEDVRAEDNEFVLVVPSEVR